MQVKKGSVTSHTSKQLRIEAFAVEADPALSHPLPVYLGLELGRLHHGRLKFAWRVDPKKVAVWKTRSVPKSGMLARDFASVIGKIVWATQVRLKPLHVIGDILQIARTLGVFVGTNYKLWKTAFNCTAETEKQLSDAWERILENEWTTYGCERGSEFFIFSDASDYGWGYVASTIDGVVLEERSFTWDTDAHREWHIFIKEVAAAIWSLKACQRFGRPVIFVDNSAAQYAIQRGYSTNRVACSIIANLGPIDFSIRRIHTSLNPSDENSRGLPLNNAKLKNAVRDWNAFVFTEPKIIPRNSCGLQHVEATNDDEDKEEHAPVAAWTLEQIYFDPSTVPQHLYKPRLFNTLVSGKGSVYLS